MASDATIQAVRSTLQTILDYVNSDAAHTQKIRVLLEAAIKVLEGK